MHPLITFSFVFVKLKTTFTFSDKIYKEIDGVSMGSPLGPLSANVFMTELEKDKIQ